MANSYKSTIFLPKTSFSMKANLPEREPFFLERWKKMGLYQKLRHISAGRKKFILHDGPPYANGHLHLGHALNKVLKDVILKSYQMKGYDTPFVPGWDCHGLPIEWQIEELFRKKGKSKEDLSILEFRKACREDAKKWINIQKEEFSRLGILGDWENPYTTLSHEAEATIVEKLLDFLLKGDIYIGEKPIMWSVVEKTALAEAEIEYKDKVSSSIYVRFPISLSSEAFLQGASAVIWTTTPWTLPGNRAIAYSSSSLYVLLEVNSLKEQESRGLQTGDKLILAQDLVASFIKTHGIDGYKILETFKGEKLEGSQAYHPFYSQGFDFEVPLLPGKHVTLEQGTGLVHTAPGHGEDDFILGRTFKLDVPKTVGPDGVYYDHVPLLKGCHIFKADPLVIEALQEERNLLSFSKITHSYPHSWRSKAPLIFRTTPQWFMRMDGNNLRDKALKAIDDVHWVPEKSKNRIYSMVKNRPDWCLSRQRSWGVPLPFFVQEETGEVLKDPSVNNRVLTVIRKEGTDAWYTHSEDYFLGDVLKKKGYKKISDIVDVWFDSGATQEFVLKKRPELAWPADLYVEGSDQHRGWFQSSLLEACAVEGQAPYKAVLTHGFVLDNKGYKMSKSLGNVITVDTILKEYGADILRLWAINSDYQEDLRIGKDILRSQQDIYRRFRNTFRFLLGGLDGFDYEEILDYKDLPDLEKYILHRLQELSSQFDTSCHTYNFQEFLSSLHNFCAVDLSAFYFDIRKDSLYCDGLKSKKRRAVRTVMHSLLQYLMRWLAPILTYTSEEVYIAWLEQRGENTQGRSIFLETIDPMPEEWCSDPLAERWKKIRSLRRVITGALEKSRAEKVIGSSLQASIYIYGSRDQLQHLKGLDLAELAIVSQGSLIESEVPKEAFVLQDAENIGIVVNVAQGHKCIRCWNVSTEVGLKEGYEDLCGRCTDVVESMEKS